MHDQWEYLTTFLFADIENPGAREYMAMHWPGHKKAKYAVQSVIPTLNDLGNEGWELVHMEPIGGVGKNEDVGFIAGDAMARWSNSYFCVFKRRR